VRQQIDGNASLTGGGMGARLALSWRGKSFLDSRIGGTLDTLQFSPVFLINLRTFIDGSRLLGRSYWTRGLRISANVVNLLNDRQKVRDSFGDTPLQYQPAYRDPIGRTVELELRKVF
jgi:outer membrane receptor protein involved in Fe transport